MPWNGNGGYNNGNGGNRFPRGGGYGGNRGNSNSRTNNREPQESTVGNTLFNDPQGRFLEFNYWGRYAQIAIGSVAPGSTANWDARRQANKVQQVIGFADLSDLQDVIEEVMDSLKNAGTFTNAALRVGSRADAMVEINNGSTINQPAGIYLVIYKNMDSSGRPGMVEFYPFTTSTIIRGYDRNSGQGKEDVAKLGQFKKFYRLVKESTKAFTMAQAHVLQATIHNDKLSQFKAMAALAAGLGVDISAELDKIRKNSVSTVQPGAGGGAFQGNNGGGFGGRQGAGYGSNGGGAPAQPSNQVLASLDDPVDINLSMNDLTNVNMEQFK